MNSYLKLVAVGVLFGCSFVTLSSAARVLPAPTGTWRSPPGKSGLKGQEAKRVKQEVEAFLAQYITTLESRDERAVRTLFVNDDRFAWFTDGVRKYSTPDQVVAGMRLYEGIRFQTILSSVRVMLLAEGLASAESVFATKLMIPSSPDVEFGGVITWLLERDSSSGNWKVLQGHTSTPGGPPAGSGSQEKR